MLRRTPAQKATAAGRLREIFGCIPRFRPVWTGHATGLCPSHDDHDPSLGIWAGDDHDYTWSCKARCDPRCIRADFTDKYGIRAELLGSYCRERSPVSLVKPAAPVDYRAECDRLRSALATERGKVASMLAVLADESITRETELRARIMLAGTGAPKPDSYRAIFDLAIQAGGRTTQAKQLAHLWLQEQVSTGPG